MPSNYRRLVAYQLAASLAVDIYRRVATWPAFHRNTIGAQVVRSAGSIGANIAESSGRWHPREKRQFFIVARGSLYETEHWLAQARLCGLTTPEPAPLEELARTLNGLISRPTPK
jgi:four helix bundle protein